MPKLYIKQYNPVFIKGKFNTLDEYYVSSKKVNMLFGKDGIYNIKNDNIYKLLPVDKPIDSTKDFLIDNSYFNHEEVTSQIPCDYSQINITEMHYCVGKQSNVHFVIEGIYKKRNAASLSVHNKHVHSRYDNFYPYNCYFYTEENINNELLMKEVNLLLSLVR